ncbi:sensor histidine kinase [Sphingomonas sp. 8AM]|uniref:sensor histidine kinase n=1 Tax=Sphingomonas sp. 8AM TaxID=2653170 RepID=UPI0012F2CCB9|nr:stimulus-sensing domain-containing protein [Sphingomonas sp. 8AM]VXC60633.1 Histidine kinase [Sphingomonas sp. 8AM]
MAPATAFRRSDAAEQARAWSGKVSLTPRILAVNVLALLLLAGGFFYLESFRSRILDQRSTQAGREVRLMTEALTPIALDARDATIARLARETGTRVRLYDRGGALLADSRALGIGNFRLDDPDDDPLARRSARWLDAAIDRIVRAPLAPGYREQRDGRRWPDVSAVFTGAASAQTLWRAPDRTPVITAAAPLGPHLALLTAVNARDVTERVRAERYRLSVVVLVASAISIGLSLYLARTIVVPLRLLARAAVRVRLGRAREVTVPRLPERRDEIGMLARALSDMTLALRARIDATEAFAADVTHELKNPLASLRSATDALSRVEQPKLRARLLAIVNDDVHRLDRLISDISDASRLDAQLSRATFEPVDVAAMLAAMVAEREARGPAHHVRVRFDPLDDELVVAGEGARLERVFANLIDNAISFSPDGGTVTIAARRDRSMLEVWVEDEGPGVPEEAREAIFRRFHSVRPSQETFGQHSGLGLAIARTIVEAHQGEIGVESREDRLSGARFVVRLPLATRA